MFLLLYVFGFPFLYDCLTFSAVFNDLDSFIACERNAEGDKLPLISLTFFLSIKKYLIRIVYKKDTRSSLLLTRINC